jgi:Domain of unknown function (DUF4296)
MMSFWKFIAASGLMMVTSGGCGSVDKPEGVLSKPQMVSALKDIYVMEQKVDKAVHRVDSAKQIFPYFESKVFDAQGLNDSTFRASYNYYMEHPDQLDQVYAMLIDTLNLLSERARIAK